MRDAQQEIKATVTVNTSDIAVQAHEDKEQGKEMEKLKKRDSGIIAILLIVKKKENYVTFPTVLSRTTVLSSFI